MVETHQLTVRAVFVGCVLGAIVGASNIYLGLKTGFTFGPQLFGAIFGFAILKPLSRMIPESGLLGKLMGGPFGPKENCTVQSAATASGGLGILFVSAIPAMYRLGLLSEFPQQDVGKLIALAASAGFFGVFFVIPLRRYYIVHQKLIFPTPAATAYTIRSLHSNVGAIVARKKSLCLLYTFVTTFVYKVITNYAPAIIFDWHIGWTLYRLGFTSIISLENYGWYIEFTPAFFGAGMLSGNNASWSFFLGSVLAWGIIAPSLVKNGLAFGVEISDEYPLVSYQALSFKDPSLYVAHPSPRYWLLWPGVMVMLLYSFSDIILTALPLVTSLSKDSLKPASWFRRQELDPEDEDQTPMEDRVPTLWWTVGLFLSIIMCCAILATLFSMNVGEALLALILGFFFSFIGVQSAGQTDVNPVTTVAKASQLIFGGIGKGAHLAMHPSQMLNLSAGVIAGGSAAQACDMTGDLKTGYLLRAKPRNQFVAQLCGAVVAIFLITGLFILFSKASPCILYLPDSGICKYAAPSVAAWAAVAVAVSSPKLPVPASSGYTAIALGIASVITVVAKHYWIPKKYHGYIPNWNAIGLGFVVPQVFYSIAMVAGCTFNVLWRRSNPVGFDMYMFAVAAGLVAGEGLGGVFQALLAIIGVDGSKYGTAIGCPDDMELFCTSQFVTFPQTHQYRLSHQSSQLGLLNALRLLDTEPHYFIVMKITGSGSRLSPIAIDDSEDEVLQELVGEASFEYSLLSVTNQRDKVPTNGISANASTGSRQKPSFEDKTLQKRKRSMNDSGPIASTSQQRLDSATHMTEVLSKKARKRRRKLERLLQERGGQPPHPPIWLNDAHHPSHELPGPHIWDAVGMGLDKPLSVSGPYSTYNMANYVAQQHNSEIPVASSSSSWVASMAMAAAVPMSNGRGAEGWGSSSPHRSDHPQPSGHNKVHFSEPIPAPEPPPAPPPASIPAFAAPTAPLSTQTIGMKPDHDPSSKHGLFVIPPNTTKGNADASSKGEPYIPNPARTLVIEQLPKSHRTQDWVNKWSKSACGAYPVFLCIDHPGAKALVEFATAELARKAWGSPRLGVALVGLKTHQLKGRPREDLIKVWWYRVDGVGANAGVGEIEEGEIEGDAAEKEIEVPVKKETKKERKARLLRERQAKKLAAAAKLPAPLQQTSQVNVAAPDIPASKGASTPQLLSLLPNPVDYSQVKLSSGYPYCSITPQPLPHPLSQSPSTQFASIRHSRAPLPPQSTLETQWRLKHELPKKPTRETILNATASSISSSKSPSPMQSSSSTAQSGRTLFSLPVSPTYEDMDVDDDMDLESPRTAKRATFDPTPALSIQAPAPGGATQTLTTQVISVAIPDLLTSPVTSKIDSTTLDSVHDTSASLSITESTANQFAAPLLELITSRSSSASGTPPLEPRAMKNAPKGPSFKVRSLLARQRELEERIARSKVELGLVTTPVPPTASMESLLSTTGSSLQEDKEDKKAMEERLRSLVLRSQKSRSRSSASTTLSTTDAQIPSPISTLASPLQNDVASSTTMLPEAPASVPATPSVQASTFSLDDLAVSFITETIETFKATPNPPTPAPSSALASGPATTGSMQKPNFNATAVAKQKFELAVQQKRLEAQIAETKVLMAKFEKAQTKQEREAILAAMREQSRVASMSKDDNDFPTNTTVITVMPTTTTTVNQVAQVQSIANNAEHTLQGYATVHGVKKWPGSHENDSGVLIVSDDDDETDGDDE
ncbi:Putative oligopeptide transporter [Termitomyces sp. J132]|nr:Putative oligopeptide transporter [Termitomyces sp. J132]